MSTHKKFNDRCCWTCEKWCGSKKLVTNSYHGDSIITSESGMCSEKNMIKREYDVCSWYRQDGLSSSIIEKEKQKAELEKQKRQLERDKWNAEYERKQQQRELDKLNRERERQESYYESQHQRREFEIRESSKELEEQRRLLEQERKKLEYERWYHGLSEEEKVAEDLRIKKIKEEQEIKRKQEEERKRKELEERNRVITEYNETKAKYDKHINKLNKMKIAESVFVGLSILSLIVLLACVVLLSSVAIYSSFEKKYYDEGHNKVVIDMTEIYKDGKPHIIEYDVAFEDSTWARKLTTLITVSMGLLSGLVMCYSIIIINKFKDWGASSKAALMVPVFIVSFGGMLGMFFGVGSISTKTGIIIILIASAILFIIFLMCNCIGVTKRKLVTDNELMDKFKELSSRIKSIS